jgi:hypothetical protein
VIVIGVAGLAPLERTGRAAGAPNIRIDAGVVPFAVDESEFGGTTGRQHPSRIELREEQAFEARRSEHAIDCLDDAGRAADAIDLLDEF